MIKRLFGSIIDVRKGEVTVTLLMFFYIFTLLLTYLLLRPARDSLFLIKLGPQQLPIVYILIAVIVVPIITLYSRASRNFKLNQLINATTLILIINLVILRWLLEFNHSSVFYTFYIWVSIYGILATSQFWLLANAVFDATQAKRMFVLFGLGAIIGAFTGGELTAVLVDTFNVSTENLLFFCMGFLVICIFMVSMVWRSRPDVEVARPSRRKTEKKESYAEIFKTIKKSRHLILIVGIIAMTMATSTFVDYQFKTISVQSFTTKEGLTVFFGTLYGRLSLISFLFQLLISYRFLRLFGVGGAILLLPFALAAGSTLLLIMPGLLAAVLLKGGDVFKYSIDKTGRELLFLPVPLDVKKRTKVFIDIFVDRWFRGFAGGLLFLLVYVLGWSVRMLSSVVIIMLLIWLSMVFMMRKEYINAFRKALERREIDLSDLRINIAEASTLETLTASLKSSNDRQIVYALGMLEGVQDSEIAGAVQPLLRHKSADVRRGAVKLLRTSTDAGLVSEMEKLLKDDDPPVRRDAMFFLCHHSDVDDHEALGRYLRDPDPQIQSAAVGCVAQYGGTEAQRLIDEEVVQSLLKTEGPDGVFARTQLAEALGGLNNPAYKKHLSQLIGDRSPEVVNQALMSIGKLGDRGFLPDLLERLKDKQSRKAARDALARFGDRIAGTLSDYVIDRSVSFSVRTNLCRVLGQIPTQHSVDTLMGIIEQVEPEIRYYVIKALNALRARDSGFRFSHDALNGALIDETESYYTIIQILHVYRSSDDPAGRLLQKALNERINDNIERMFRLLGLRYTQKDIYSAYLGIIGDKKHLKANAIEFLDNLLRKEVKKYMFPVVDDITDDLKIKKGRELFGVNLQDQEAALLHLIDGSDPWLRACAIYASAKDLSPKLKEAIQKAQSDPHPIIQETAEFVLARA